MPFEAKPTGVYFGQLRRNSPTKHQTITLLRGDGGPISPEVSLGRIPSIDAQICEIEPGEHYELEVWMTPPWPEGRFSDRLEISTGVDEAPTASITVAGKVLPRLTAIPQRLNYFGERTSSTVRSLTFRWDGPPGKILSAKCTIPEATAIIRTHKGAQMVDVRLPPGSEPIPGRHSVLIKTDDAEVPTVSVPIAFRLTSNVLSLQPSATRTATAAQPPRNPRGKKGPIKR